MRVISILAVLAIIAIAFHIVWLGTLVFYFIFGCALFGVGETIKDAFNGGLGIEAQMRRHLQSLPPGFNPRYHNMRRRGISHEECFRRGEPPIRPADYFEKAIAKEVAAYKEAQETGDYSWFTSPARLRGEKR
jgi:hypothetical protein